VIVDYIFYTQISEFLRNLNLHY